MPDPRIAQLEAAGWSRRGPFYSPPGSSAKYTLGAAAQMASASGARPDRSWKKGDIAFWLSQAGVTVDPAATKTDLLESVAAVR